MTVEQLIDSIAVRLRSEDVDSRRWVINLELTDRDEIWRVELSNRTISASPFPAASPDATVRLAHVSLVEIASGQSTPDTLLNAGRLDLYGTPEALAEVFGHLDVFESMFPIVEP